MSRWSVLALMGLCACTNGLQPVGTLDDEAFSVAFPHGDIGAYTDCEVLELLDWLNAPTTTAEVIKAAGVHTRAADNIEAHRAGDDGVLDTVDDRYFETAFEVDDVSYVGPVAMEQLMAYSTAQCIDEPDNTGIIGEQCADDSLLTVLNDSGTDAELIKAEGVHTQAANNIVAYRNGEDGLAGTDDDETIDDMEELDAIPYVGPAAMEDLDAWGGRLCSPAEAIMSPQDYEDSHLARVEELIGQAERSIDVMMYSFRDSSIKEALVDAHERGVSIRLILEKTSEDRKDPENTLSSHFEDAGIECRWVNKIQHHKMAIIDGVRTDLSEAREAIVINGSGNWSYSAGTKFDENTVFSYGDEKLSLLFQREFELLWNNSRDFEWNETILAITGLEITDADIEAAQGSHAVFTSANFRTYVSSTYGPTFSIDGNQAVVGEALSAFIDAADHSVQVASGHARSREVADALIRAHERGVDVEVYLDGQEYVSSWYANGELDDYDDCLAEAGTDQDDIYDCDHDGMYFGYWLAQAGVDVRYKYYAYRWDYTYAPQMHHKYVIVDGDQVASGSYNHSPNAEWDTFENLVFYDASRYPTLVETFVDNFETIREIGRSEGLYNDLVDEIENGTSSSFPIVFEPMALDWEEVNELKSVIWENCPEINSDDFRENPASHQWCDRG